MLTYRQADDTNIKRNRTGRWMVFAGLAAGMPTAGLLGSTALGNYFFSGVPAMSFLLGASGAFLGFVGFLVLKSHRMTVINDTTGVFITVDALRSLFKRGKINVTYGPGTHISYPWEQRYKENNIPVLEATNEFNFVVNCKDGILYGKGSYRLRPDPQNPVAFISGVAAVADDLKDLIIAKVAAAMKDMSIMDATSQIEPLNETLKNEFVVNLTKKGRARKAPTKFENRFGIQVGDVTIKELLPSDEVQKTLSALTEAAAIRKGTAILLGLTEDTVTAALRDGIVTQAAYDLARDRFMAASGNLEGVKVQRYELMLNASGIDKDTAEALAAMLSRIPPSTIAAVAAQATGDKSKKGGQS